MTGEAITVWSVRAALLFYVAALALWLGRQHLARLAWTVGCLLYLAHVFAAFQYFHGWSHAAAYRETARQTAELVGIAWGAGLYFNYAFTLVWLADVFWCWRGIEVYAKRPRWIAAAVHAFLAFMFFNGAVVFASGFSRWVGIAAIPAIFLVWLTRRKPAPGALTGKFG